MIKLQHIIETKRELLGRETYSRNPVNYSEGMSEDQTVNYSEGMAEDQKDRYIQYLAEQNQELKLNGEAMKLVLDDFMS